MNTPLPILLYHGVAAESPAALAPYVMHPDLFAAHMGELAGSGRTTFTVSALLDLLDAGGQPPAGSVLVTFDDGLADFGQHAWPVVHGLGLSATLYVVTGCLGDEARWLRRFGEPVPRMLTWDQVVQLDAEGCEIGAHSHAHPELDLLEADRLVDEVATSRTVLSEGLGHPVRSFAYPHGYHRREVIQAVRAAGYDSACAVRNMLSSTADDRFRLARVTITADTTVERLRGVLDGDHLPVAPRPEQLRTLAWRGYRRVRSRVGAG